MALFKGDNMPGQIRPDEKVAKILNKILKTPKEKQQDNQKEPSEKLKKEWFTDSSQSQ